MLKILKWRTQIIRLLEICRQYIGALGYKQGYSNSINCSITDIFGVTCLGDEHLASTRRNCPILKFGGISVGVWRVYLEVV